MAEDLAGFSNQRHPGIPSPTATRVLRSGVLGVDEDQNVIRNVGRYECIEGLPGKGGKKLGYVWRFQCMLGTVLIPEASLTMFHAATYRHEGRKYEAARLTLGSVKFDQKAEEIAERAIVLPFVDRTKDAKSSIKAFMMRSSYHYMASQDDTGTLRDYSLTAQNDSLAPPEYSLLEGLDMRWAREFEALTIQVLDEALGESFWPDMQQKLRDKGLRSVPVDDRLTYANFTGAFGHSRMRVLDGPTETCGQMIIETMAALEQAGFTVTKALAAFYLFDGAFEMPPPEGTPGSTIWFGAMQDRKFAKALRDRWMPTHETWLQIAQELSGTPRQYPFPANLEQFANGT